MRKRSTVNTFRYRRAPNSKHWSVNGITHDVESQDLGRKSIPMWSVSFLLEAGLGLEGSTVNINIRLNNMDFIRRWCFFWNEHRSMMMPSSPDDAIISPINDEMRLELLICIRKFVRCTRDIKRRDIALESRAYIWRVWRAKWWEHWRTSNYHHLCCGERCKMPQNDEIEKEEQNNNTDNRARETTRID